MVLVFNGLSSLRKVTSNNSINQNRSTSDIINIINKVPKCYTVLKKDCIKKEFFFK